MTSKEDAEKYILYFDELQEKKPTVPVELYRDQLLKWGIPKDKVSTIIQLVDPKKKGYISRTDICNGINYDPVKLKALKDVKFIKTDMPPMQRDSVALLMLDVIHEKKDKHTVVNEIKTKLERIYDGGWTVFICKGPFWASNEHKPGTLLSFVYQGYVYGALEASQQ